MDITSPIEEIKKNWNNLAKLGELGQKNTVRERQSWDEAPLLTGSFPREAQFPSNSKILWVYCTHFFSTYILFEENHTKRLSKYVAKLKIVQGHFFFYV